MAWRSDVSVLWPSLRTQAMHAQAAKLLPTTAITRTTALLAATRRPEDVPWHRSSCLSDTYMQKHSAHPLNLELHPGPCTEHSHHEELSSAGIAHSTANTVSETLGAPQVLFSAEWHCSSVLPATSTGALPNKANQVAAMNQTTTSRDTTARAV